jgi:hypothetical protein
MFNSTCFPFRENLMGDEGLEPARENAGKTLAERVFVEAGGAPGGAIENDRPEVGAAGNVEAIKAALAALSPERLAEVLAAAIQSGTFGR